MATNNSTNQSATGIQSLTSGGWNAVKSYVNTKNETYRPTES